MKTRRIKDSTIVIVGATSGVGKATARSLAAIGARLVIVARTAADVDAVADECRVLGATVVGVAADISKPGHVDRIVAEATAHFGAIDTWINAAAALIVGELHLQPVDQIEQIIATNVLGTTLASRAAMIHFRSRNAGVLINMSSLLGVVPNPVVPTYSMTKFAVRGLTLGLHQSTWPRSPINVCIVLPGPIDTPMFARASNHSGRAIRAIPPAFSPERVAATVIRSVRRPRRQRTTGISGAVIVIGLHVLPRFTETVVAQIAARLLPIRRRPNNPRRTRRRQRCQPNHRRLAPQPRPHPRRRHRRPSTRPPKLNSDSQSRFRAALSGEVQVGCVVTFLHSPASLPPARKLSVPTSWRCASSSSS